MFKDYADYDATGLAELIARGEVSAPEVLEAALARIAAGEARLNAMAEIFAERARARAAGPLAGPFAGVPFLIKDHDQELEGERATSGAVAKRAFIAPYSAEVTKRFLAAGVVIAGATTTPELAMKATTETILHGTTRNPWDVNVTPGGSSGGSAAAVAAGYVPMAGANDGAGSIRGPAAYCGLFGLKPSRGRVPNGPDHGEVWDGASQNHVLTRSVRDSARMLDAIAGPELGGPFAIAPPARPFAAEVGAKVERLRIGFSVRSPIGGRVEAEPTAAAREAAKLLESLGHEVEEAAPEIPDGLIMRCFIPVLYGHIAALVRSICARTGAPESTFHTDTRVIAMLGRTISAADFVAARQGWNELARAVALFHQRYDLYMTPATAFGPARIGALDISPAKTRLARAMIALRAGGMLMRSGLAQQAAFEALERVPFSVLANMSYAPAMSVPLHWGADGLPVGVHFSAAHGAEGLLFRLAAQLEEARPWAARRPPGFA